MCIFQNEEDVYIWPREVYKDATVFKEVKKGASETGDNHGQMEKMTNDFFI